MSRQEQNFLQGETNDDENESTKYVLRLFVTGASPNSIRAITNLKNICETYIKGKYLLEVIDVYQLKSIAETEQIVALPMLIRITPLPQRRLIGDMSDANKVLRGLGLA